MTAEELCEALHEKGLLSPAIEKVIRGTEGPAVSACRKRSGKATLEEGRAVSQLIAIYVDAWRQRYNTRATPDIGGKARGILLRLVRNVHPAEAGELIQVYCQMKTKLFEDRKHDLVTFELCLNQISLALDKGDESSINWDQVFGDTHGTKRLSDADTSTGGELQRKRLPVRTD